MADIVITKSGATRCKTNIRFALNELREIGLVLSKDPENKRSWSPSIAGLVVLLNMRLNPDKIQNDTLLQPHQQPGAFKYDPTIIKSIRMFRDPTHLYCFLDNLKMVVSDSCKEFLDTLIHKYIDFVEEGLEITPDGIRLNKEFKVLAEKFRSKLLIHEDENEGLHQQLFSYYRNL